GGAGGAGHGGASSSSGTSTSTSSSAGGQGTGAGGAHGHCGDGVIQAGEQCDGPNLNNQDCTTVGFTGGSLSCTSTCHLDTSACTGVEDCENGHDDDGDGQADCSDSDCTNACANACTDLPTLADGASVHGVTTGHAAGATPACADASGSGPENGYVYTAPASGFLVVQAQPLEDGGGNLPNLTLSVRTQCADAGSALACKTENGAGLLVAEMNVTAGDVLTFTIDGYSAADAGAYQLTATTYVASCGNGVVEPPEQCDDGNVDAGDGCSPTCQVELSETESNDTPATANPFDDAQHPWYGAVSPAGDVDCVSIQATADGQQLKVEVDDTGDGACAIGALDSFVRIYDADGTTQIASDDDSGDGLCSRAATGNELVAGQTYYVCISATPQGPNHTSTFDYALVLTLQ
ncbi:MAG TPA: DUF4215 domain-containing protein, partial [Minicystis sp.]|nr:DUF4215 domain-containing protein [Minicystis sp.]